MLSAEIIVMPTKNHNLGNKWLRIYFFEKHRLSKMMFGYLQITFDDHKWPKTFRGLSFTGLLSKYTRVIDLSSINYIILKIPIQLVTLEPNKKISGSLK